MNTVDMIAVSTEEQIRTVEPLAREIWTEQYTLIIGSVQVDYILDRPQSYRAITLAINKNDRGSIGAYEKLGFRIIVSLVQDIGNGFVMDDFQLEKRLTP